MKVLGIIFTGLCLVGLGIAIAKFGWFDVVVSWFDSLVK